MAFLRLRTETHGVQVIVAVSDDGFPPEPANGTSDAFEQVGKLLFTLEELANVPQLGDCTWTVQLL
jgi:hypothetical protein